MKKIIVIALLLILCSTILRLWFMRTTHLTLEDALISFRYVENIADGNGFVYNENEHVLGTTTPLWTLLLAAVKTLGISDIITASKIISIFLDAATLILIWTLLPGITNEFTALLCAVFFISSPDLIPLSVSGMETSLVLFSMAVTMYGYVRKNYLFAFGMALMILTRIDGLLFVGVLTLFIFVSNSRWTLKQLLIAVIILMPWMLFSFFYFGDIIPQSIHAKFAAYHLGVVTSSASFLTMFTPVLEENVWKFIIKSIALVTLIAGMIIGIRKEKVFLPLSIFFFIYCAAFMCSGGVIFAWYLAPVVFIGFLFQAIGIGRFAEYIIEAKRMKLLHGIALPLCVLVIGVGQSSILYGRVEKYQQLQQKEETVRMKIGLWLRNNAEHGARIFLEPTGYIGYYAGTDINILDEIGLVAPAVIPFHARGDGWYVPALQSIKPDYIVQYGTAIESNETEATHVKLFSGDEDRKWFSEHFELIKVFDERTSFPLIDQKEKYFMIFKSTNKQ
jgi:hypothetical protein